MFLKLRPKLIDTYFQLLNFFRIYENKITFYDGGLGAQIVSHLRFLDKASNFNAVNIKNTPCDISYFYRNPRGNSADENGVSLRKWRLDRYGITLESFNDLQVSKIRKNLKSRRRNAYNIPQVHDDEWARLRTLFSKNFPICSEKSEIDGLLGFDSDNTKFACIHIRRGDFVSIGARIVRLESYFSLIKKFKILLPFNVIFFSDINLPNNVTQKFRNLLENHQTKFITGESVDEGLVHDTMRKAHLLVCANSMFSFTAGILNVREALVFSPTVFFNGDSKKRNSGRIFSLPFTAAGEFLIMD